MAKKILLTLSEIVALDRKALAPYLELEQKNSLGIIKSFFDDAMAPIRQIIELRMSLTSEHYHADLWTQRYGSSETERKIAEIDFPLRVWQLEAAKAMLPEVQAAIQSGLDGADPQPLVAKLVDRRVNLMLGFFTTYRYAIQSQSDTEKAMHFLAASVYRRLSKNNRNGVPMRYARSLEFDHPQQAFTQAVTEELPGGVAILKAESGLGPAAIASMHTAFAKSVERSEPDTVTRNADLLPGQSLEAIVDGHPNPLESLLAAEEVAWAEAQLAALPEKERMTMQLRLEGSSYSEIAIERGVGVETIREQLKRARAKLRAASGSA